MEQVSLKNISLNDQKTWSLFHEGRTRGVFQCESKLVQHWLKKIKPVNIWELSVVIAIVRPGALESGFAEMYVENKSKDESEIESFGHPVIDEIFAVNKGVLIFQESLISLARKLAWPHLPENENLLKADLLRKAVGKKDQAKILVIGKEFVEGCLHNGVTQEVADKLFEVIKNCGRYLFNLSHSFQYATVAYFTAYLKVHHTLQFYSVYQSYAKHKQSIKRNGKEIGSKFIEIKELANDAKKMGITLVGPNINYKNQHFKIADFNGTELLYGLTSIKWCTSLGTKLDNFPNITNWQQFLLLTQSKHYGFTINKTCAESLVRVGAFKDVGLNRSLLINLSNFYRFFTDTELQDFNVWLVNNKDAKIDIKDLAGIVKEKIEGHVTSRRIEKVKEHFMLWEQDIKVEDHPAAIEEWEIDLLGIAISASALDTKEYSTHTCDECTPEINEKWARKVLHVKLNAIKFTQTKTGQNPGQRMAILDVSDYTGTQQFPVFPEQFTLYEELLMEGNTVKLLVVNGKKGFFVEEIEQL